MNSQSIQELVIAPQDGNEKHFLLQQHEAIKQMNGSSYDRSYWARVEKYEFSVLSSNITLNEMNIYYDVISDNYILQGKVSLIGDKLGIKREGYYFDDGGESYITSGWSTYSENIKMFLNIDSTPAADLGLVNGLVNRNFSINLGDTKPDSVEVSVSCIGVVSSTKEDIAGEYFTLPVEGVLASEVLTIPSMTIVPGTISLNDIEVAPKTFEKNHENINIAVDGYDEVEYKNFKWIYRLLFESGINISNLEINYNETTGTYVTSGNIDTSYTRTAEETSWWEDLEEATSYSETKEWTQFDDSICKIGLYINNNLCLDMGSILEEGIINQNFEYDMGSDIPQDFILTLKFTGKIQSINADAEGVLFTLNDSDSVVTVHRVSMPFKQSDYEETSLQDLFVFPNASSETLPTTEEYIEKRIGVFEGWRYMIGIRDVDIKNRKYEAQSDIITKKFETKKPIKKILLYSNEIIPDKFIETGLNSRNEWIKYFISVNDTDWHRISPMHHNQVGNLKISPKIYEINSKDSPEEKIETINKGYISSSIDVKTVRLKITLTRPDGMEDLTPIIEEYALKCITEEEV